MERFGEKLPQATKIYKAIQEDEFDTDDSMKEVRVGDDEKDSDARVLVDHARVEAQNHKFINHLCHHDDDGLTKSDK